MQKRTWTIEQLREAVANSYSIAEVLRALNLKPAGGNYKQIHKYIKEYNLEFNQNKGRGWSKGRTLGPRPRIPLSEILVENSSYQSARLRQRLIEEKYFEAKCYSCGLTEWLGQPISLELDHINGINTDNRLENLTILCPNCHAQTPTYRGKNIQAGLVESGIHRGLKSPRERSHTGSSPVSGTNKCSCGKKIHNRAKCCKRCVVKPTVIDWPSNEELLEMLSKSNYSKLAKELGVSDNAIRKRIRSHQ